MIDEEALSYKRGEVVEFNLRLGGGTKTCHGLVLNTGVLYGKGARQVWILDIENAEPEQKEKWKNKKLLVAEGDLISLIPRHVIGADTLLRENPLSYPVRNFKEERETPALVISVPLPIAKKQMPVVEQQNQPEPDGMTSVRSTSTRV